MDAKEFKEIQSYLSFTNGQLADSLNTSVRAIEEWRGGRNSIPGPVTVLLRLFAKMKAEGRLSLNTVDMAQYNCDSTSNQAE